MIKCFILFCVVGAAIASPKKYNSEEGNFQPVNRYHEYNLPSANHSAKYESKESKESSDRLRFGIPISNYGNSGSGPSYGNGNGVGYMVTPMKIDIGGIALGALIGLGAILIVPKLAHVFSGGHGYRSIENDMYSLTDILARIDNSLEQHNIDSSSCMQRIICTYVNEAEKNMNNGEATTVDQFLFSIINNSFFSYMLDGTSVKQAIEMGRQGDIEKCATLYPKCPISKENVMKVISTLLPA